MTEIWKDILSYEGLYQISNLGNAIIPQVAYEIFKIIELYNIIK
jgi:hypothetical protein